MKGLSDVEDLLAEVGDEMEIVKNLQIMGGLLPLYIRGSPPTCYVFPSKGKRQNP